MEDASSSAGNLIITEDGGRQTITYVLPPGEFSDDISYRINVGWIYFLIQFWVYPTIVLILMVMFVRRRRRKKKAKKAALANRQAAVNKAQIGDHEFADLAGFASPGLRHGETIEDMALGEEYGFTPHTNRNTASRVTNVSSTPTFFDDGSDVGDSGSGLGDTMGADDGDDA